MVYMYSAAAVIPAAHHPSSHSSLQCWPPWNSTARCVLSTIMTTSLLPLYPPAVLPTQAHWLPVPKQAKVNCLCQSPLSTVLSYTDDVNDITMEKQYCNFCRNLIHDTSICTECSACMCHQFERGSSGCIIFKSLKHGTAFCCILCHYMCRNSGQKIIGPLPVYLAHLRRKNLLLTNLLTVQVHWL